jgi:hypothetical protein
VNLFQEKKYYGVVPLSKNINKECQNLIKIITEVMGKGIMYWKRKEYLCIFIAATNI